MSKVFIEKCESYEYKKVEEIIFSGMGQMEELENRIFKGCHVLVKPNLLRGNKPEEGVTTHPVVVEAVVRYLKKKGCIVTLADSPGGPFTESALRAVYKNTGLAEVAEKTGCALNYSTEGVMVENKKAKKLLKMEVIKIATEVDFIVNVAKLKTHCMMTYTGAVKNLFGLIPGLIKADYHLKMKSNENFAEHLVDICEFAKPVLHIIDGIVGMEGDGPSAGTLRNSGILIVSDNPYSADIVGSKIIGIDETLVPTIMMAKTRRLIGSTYEEIEFSGLKPEDLKIEPFKLPETTSVTFMSEKVPSFVETFVMENLRPKPIILKSKCVKCGVCVEVCPAKTIEMAGGLPEIKLDHCIRCFCCHELCPKKAIGIKRNFIYDKLMGVNR